MIDFFDSSFRLILIDHKKLLINTATRYKLSESIRDVYRYRDVMFCIEELNLPKDYLWLLKFLNGIDELSSLLDNKVLIIPDPDIIQVLYDKYLIFKSHKSQLNVN